MLESAEEFSSFLLVGDYGGFEVEERSWLLAGLRGFCCIAPALSTAPKTNAAETASLILPIMIYPSIEKLKLLSFPCPSRHKRRLLVGQ